jgi:urease alpha subunit
MLCGSIDALKHTQGLTSDACLDTVLTNALIVDHSGIYKARETRGG